MSPAVLTLLTFLAGVLVVIGLYSILSDLFLRDRTQIQRRVDDEFRDDQRDRVKKSALFKHLEVGGTQPKPEDEETFTLRQKFDTLVEQSGLNLTPQRLLIIMGAGAALLGVLGLVLSQHPLPGLLGALVGAVGPLWYVRAKRRARLAKLLSQLPDAFDLMARVVRSGQTVSQAMLAVADEFDAPVATEFGYCYEQQNLGLLPEVTLRDLVRRTGVLEIKIFVLAMVVQQQTGGNLAELLDKLSGIIRERFRINGKIKTLTAEGRFQAIVLLVLPVALFFMILAINPRYGRVLLDHPSLIVGTCVAEALGAVWIRKIVHFDY